MTTIEMTKLAKTTCIYIFLLLLLVLASNVSCRSLLYTSSKELVSDGIDHQDEDKESSSFLRFKGIPGSSFYSSSEEENCEQMYGFLPCSNSILGHLFLITVYEYLLIKGESFVAAGGERIFNILGTGVFGASAFQVLGFLPESLILLGTYISYFNLLIILSFLYVISFRGFCRACKFQ